MKENIKIYVKNFHWEKNILVQVCRYRDSKVHGANMGPIWGRQDPIGSHFGPMNFAIWVCVYKPLFSMENIIRKPPFFDVLKAAMITLLLVNL